MTEREALKALVERLDGFLLAEMYDEPRQHERELVKSALETAKWVLSQPAVESGTMYRKQPLTVTSGTEYREMPVRGVWPAKP